ncbi:FtsX-like permease family protein [Catalinimonas sp. 4WD22]|uniref:FtsX-like permease family protein n=1 Tax=Catalinimonas locisalis TaxID=3133978 RepID=UPI0031015195
MLKNYFKIAIRNLWKRKTQTLINVLGLAVGIASSIVIFFIVQYELSFDNFHPESDRIYRVTSSFVREGETHYFNGVAKPLPEAFREDFADEIEELLVLNQTHGYVLLDGEKILIDEPKAFTETAYFSFFNIPLIAGNPSTVLSNPDKVVLTKSLYEKLFGKEQYTLGKTFTFVREEEAYELEVAGIMDDLPQNTDFRFEMLLPYRVQKDRLDYHWDNFNSAFNVFVLLPDQVHPQALSSQFEQFLKKYTGEEAIEKYQSGLYLQPLQDLHYVQRFSGFPNRKMPREILAALSGLGLLLIILACINFINLATALSTQRSKEVGVRKTMGSSRYQIVWQFLGEALLTTTLALCLALGLAEVGLLQLKKLYAYLEPVNIAFSWEVIIFFIILLLGVTNIAGLYPGWLLARFKPVQMFKNNTVVIGKSRFSLRQGLVVFQFFISQVFIVCTLVVAQQLDYLKHAPLGFDKEAIITVDLMDSDPQKRERFEAVLNRESAVKQMTFSTSSAISQSMSAGIYSVDGKETEDQANIHFADHRFFETYGMELLAGKVFTSSDSGSGFVVNESFVHELGLAHAEQAIGKFIGIWGFEKPIEGVVADYHTRDFGAKIPPLLITNRSSEYHNLSMKVEMDQLPGLLKKLEEVWTLNYPEYDFRYEFLDDRVAGFYKSYDRNYSLAQLFAGMAIFISCLGLYGLVMFMAERKTKEIGIRKVLGATARHILGFFSKEFFKLVLIAFVLSAPLAYYLMQEWLNNFAYKIEPGLLTLLISLLASIILVLITIGYQSFKAAIANPVDSLRNE